MHLRRSGAIVTGLFVFAVGGLAAAGITPSGDTNGTVTAGQVLTFSIADSFAGSAPGGPPYGWCDASAYNVSAGQASGSPYGSTASLAISCADAGQGSLTGAWTYTGSVVATVPQDAAATITETVSVHEAVPL